MENVQNYLNYNSICRIQPDFSVDLNSKVKSSFWISYAEGGQKPKSTHGRVSVNVSSGKNDLKFDAEGGFNVANVDTNQDRKWIEISAPDKRNYKFFSPTSIYQHHNKKSVNTIDISPQGELGISGSNDGILTIWETHDGTVRRNLVGHVGDLLTCRFFPSGQVVLSGGSDTQLKIWSALDGDCAATCRGHTGGILGTAIIDRGRNIISCSRDGTARLWECASQTTIRVLANLNKSINACFVASNSSLSSTTNNSRTPDERESGTEDKLVLLAGEDHYLRGIDLRSQQEAFQLNGLSPLNACVALSDQIFVAGSEEGVVFLYDSRNLTQPLNTSRRTSSPITHLSVDSNKTFYVSTADGLSYLWHADRNEVVLDLVGADCEPIYSTCARGGEVYSVSRDGNIRRYVLVN